jgi:hypothetical protein
MTQVAWTSQWSVINALLVQDSQMLHSSPMSTCFRDEHADTPTIWYILHTAFTRLALLLLLQPQPSTSTTEDPHTTTQAHSRVVVYHLAVGLVEAGCQVSLSSSQAHGIADTLAQGTCTKQHTGQQAATEVT